MLITINPEYYHLKQWIESVPQRFANERTILFQGRNTLGTLLTPDSRTLCVKKYRTPALPQRIIYTFLRKPKAERAYNNAILLLGNNIPTPKPVAYIICTKGGLIADSYLITEFCPYKRNFYEFRQHGIKNSQHIISRLAAIAAEMHNSGLYHKDFSPGNILFEDNNGEVNMTVIDINRMTTSRKVGPRLGCKNFERLWGNNDFFLVLAKEYAMLRHLSIPQCQKLTLYYHNKYWRYRK
ncbi:MAG: tyrosine protein kinase [Paludibacteraceae bacterium]|nr:tyrosine protein kinase [Paludibacteraceae bacterium]